MENNNLPMVVDIKSIWGRIKKFFSRLWENMFEKENLLKVDEEILNDTVSQMNESKEAFENSLKADINAFMSSNKIKSVSAAEERENYLDNLAQDIDSLNNMSIEELEEIEKKLDRSIISYKCKIAEVDIEERTKKLNFLDDLEEQPQNIIESSMDRLKKIEEYYDTLIAELDSKVVSN